MMAIINPSMEEASVKKLMEQFMTVVTEDGGEVKDIDYWGKRRLAYQINGLDDGFYLVAHFSCTPEACAELDRQMKLNESVVRTKVLREDKR
ncbi:MAG: 30S ribosomal protein S6 [Aeriscardovia sp.]|nr:30S ribosomal protein S6 [Aeriscardovia sp.]